MSEARTYYVAEDVPGWPVWERAGGWSMAVGRFGSYQAAWERARDLNQQAGIDPEEAARREVEYQAARDAGTGQPEAPVAELGRRPVDDLPADVVGGERFWDDRQGREEWKYTELMRTRLNRLTDEQLRAEVEWLIACWWEERFWLRVNGSHGLPQAAWRLNLALGELGGRVPWVVESARLHAADFDVRCAQADIAIGLTDEEEFARRCAEAGVPLTSRGPYVSRVDD